MTKIVRYSSVQTFKQVEYNPQGILSETTWTLLNNLTKTDNVAAVSSAIEGIAAPPKVSNPKCDSTPTSNCLTVTTRCECGKGYQNSTPHSWVNHCPACGRNGSLQLSWKKGVDNYHEQITCGGPPGDKCGADYCGVHGGSLEGRHEYQLTKCPGS